MNLLSTLPRTFRLWPLAAAATALACQAQEDPNYQGEPLAEVRGSVVADGELPTDSAAVVLWFTSTDTVECSGPSLACGGGVGGGPEVEWECVEACGYPDECSAQTASTWEACVTECGATATTSVDWEICATGAAGSQVPITGTFPASFQLDIFESPPDAGLLTAPDGGPAVALGIILAMEEDASLVFDFDSEEGLPGLLGAVPKYALIYSEEEIPAESSWGQFLGGAYTPGFHLVEKAGGELLCQPGGPDGEETCFEEPSTLHPAPDDLQTEVELEFGPIEQIGLPI